MHGPVAHAGNSKRSNSGYTCIQTTVHYCPFIETQQVCFQTCKSLNVMVGGCVRDCKHCHRESCGGGGGGGLKYSVSETAIIVCVPYTHNEDLGVCRTRSRTL